MRFLSAEGAKVLMEAQGAGSATPWVNSPHAVRAEGACRERSLNVFYSDDRRQRLGDEPVYRERSDPD
jgi:hypothetical protein